MLMLSYGNSIIGIIIEKIPKVIAMAVGMNDFFRTTSLVSMRIAVVLDFLIFGARPRLSHRTRQATTKITANAAAITPIVRTMGNPASDGAGTRIMGRHRTPK